jgi:hypothetical protein
LGFEGASETAENFFFFWGVFVGYAIDFEGGLPDWVGRYCTLKTCQLRKILLKYAPVAKEKMRRKKNI